MAEEGGKAISKFTISLGTATPGGGFPLYGNACAEVMCPGDSNERRGCPAQGRA